MAEKEKSFINKEAVGTGVELVGGFIGLVELFLGSFLGAAAGGVVFLAGRELKKKK